MKTLTYLFATMAILMTSSQAWAQTGGDDNGDTYLPAVQLARSAFYASANAFSMAQSQANYWRTQYGRHPNAYLAATYWQISANYQYQALVRLHSVWTGLASGGTPINYFEPALEADLPDDRLDLHEGRSDQRLRRSRPDTSSHYAHPPMDIQTCDRAFEAER